MQNNQCQNKNTYFICIHPLLKFGLIFRIISLFYQNVDGRFMFSIWSFGRLWRSIISSIRISVSKKNAVTHYRVKLLRAKLCDVIFCNEQVEAVESQEEILNKSHGFGGILWATHERLKTEPQLKAIATMSAVIYD